MDHLHAAVADSLSSVWCPTNKSVFLEALAALCTAFCVAGIVLIAVARTRGRVARIAGIVLILFACGMAAIDLFGLSGCGNHSNGGVAWDWPW